jgi:hypothetical protein
VQSETGCRRPEAAHLKSWAVSQEHMCGAVKVDLEKTDNVKDGDAGTPGQTCRSVLVAQGSIAKYPKPSITLPTVAY